jgi:hypothetical protein
VTALELLGLIIVLSVLFYLAFYFQRQVERIDRMEASDREYARKHPIR